MAHREDINRLQFWALLHEWSNLNERQVVMANFFGKTVLTVQNWIYGKYMPRPDYIKEYLPRLKKLVGGIKRAKKALKVGTVDNA